MGVAPVTLIATRSGIGHAIMHRIDIDCATITWAKEDGNYPCRGEARHIVENILCPS